jgi:hypothetical protein
MCTCAEEELVFNEATLMWCSPAHHSRFSNADKRACLNGINAALREGESHGDTV